MSNNSTDYDYDDQTKDTTEMTTPASSRGEEATQAELNPAYYPAAAKPEALQNEAEKEGAEFPGGTQLDAARAAQGEDPNAQPEDQSVKMEPSESDSSSQTQSSTSSSDASSSDTSSTTSSKSSRSSKSDDKS